MGKEYKGIDYGNGLTNIDIDNNIRYGVIHQNEVLQAWCDSSEPFYGIMDCPKCGNEIDLNTGTFCLKCDYELEGNDLDFLEIIGDKIDDDEYQAQSDDQGDIFIFNSPYYTYAQFCSPCAPGACYLMNWLNEKDNNNKCYCLGHDFFDDGKAPYPVYDVKTDKEVTKNE